VGRRLVPWGVCLSLMLAGTEVAHWLAFRLVYPGAYERDLVLQQTGHGYFAWLPIAGGIGGALLLSALVLHGWRAGVGGHHSISRAGLLRFAALPPLAFALQEHLEGLISGGTVVGVAFEPTFMLGVLLTLPFALAAYLVARLLLHVADRVGRVLRQRRTFRLRRSTVPTRRAVPGSSFALRMPALAAGFGERGPPL
jgi:hypothetical protein